MLASILAYGFPRTDVYLPLPLWRRKSIRPSILDLLNLLREQIFARQMPGNPTPGIDDFAAPVPPVANADQFQRAKSGSYHKSVTALGTL